MKQLLRFLFCLMLCLVLSLSAAFAEGEELHHQTESGLMADGAIPSRSGLDVLSKANTKSFKSYMLPKLKALSSRIEVSQFRLTPDEFSEVYWSMLDLNPEYFYVAGRYSYYTSGGIVTAILPTYRYAASDIPGRVKAFEASVNAIVAQAKKSDTPVGQLLRVYDYFCVNFAYDETYTRYQPDELFATGSGVCNAYALAYCAVLNQLDFTHDLTTSESLNHIWNMVKVGGKWYHIDATWGDPISDMPLRVMHDNFLRSDAGIIEAGHYGWATTHKASSTKYDNYFWKNINYPLCMEGDVVYYVSNDFTHPSRTVYAHDLQNSKTKSVYSYRYSTGGAYYRDYNPVWVVGTDIFYVTGHELYRASTTGGTATRVYTTGSGTTVWGINQVGDALKLYAANGYNNNGKLHSYTIILDYTIELNKSFLEMKVGEQRSLKYTVKPATDFDVSVAWSVKPTGPVKVSAAGRVTARAPGLTRVTATVPSGKSAACTILVHDDAPLQIPAGTKVIEADAFRNSGVAEVILPEGLERIESGAFAGCTKLRLLHLPESAITIAQNAFDGVSTDLLLVLCESENGFAARYARQNGLAYMVK